MKKLKAEFDWTKDLIDLVDSELAKKSISNNYKYYLIKQRTGLVKKLKGIDSELSNRVEIIEEA